jgi:hypothetical protein
LLVYQGTLEYNVYTLKYPGISFLFPIPESFLPLKPNELPFLSEDNTTPILTRIQIYHGACSDEATLKPLGDNSIYFEPVVRPSQ